MNWMLCRRIFLLCLLANLAGPVLAQKQPPYGVPCGTIVYDMPRTKERVKFYFIDNGRKFRSEFYNVQNKLYQVELYDGDTLYSRSLEKHETSVLGPIRDLNNFLSKTEKVLQRKPKFKKGAPRTIIGKPCQQFYYFNPLMKDDFVVCSWEGIEFEVQIGDKIFKKIQSFDPSLPAASLFLKRNLPR